MFLFRLSFTSRRFQKDQMINCTQFAPNAKLKLVLTPLLSKKQVILQRQPVSLCLTSLQHQGHVEMAPPFTVPCEGREARQIHGSHRESNPGPSRARPLSYRCSRQAPLQQVRAIGRY